MTESENYFVHIDEQNEQELILAVAESYRQTSKRNGGVVLIWFDENYETFSAYGWKNCLRDAAHERPNAIAVDEQGHVFMAEGGNDYDGAKCWVAISPN